MKRSCRFVLIIISLLIITKSDAQDTIYPKGSEEPIKGKIVSRRVNYIGYLPAHNPNEKVKIYLRDIDSVVYESGKAEHFSQHWIANKPSRGKLDYLARRGELPKSSIVSAGYRLHQFGRLPTEKVYVTGPKKKYKPVSGVYLSYERFFLYNSIGVEVAPYIGLNEGAAGLSITPRLYTTGSTKIQMGFGPEFTYMQQKLKKGTLRNSSLSLNVKALANINSNLSLNLQANVGGILKPEKERQLLLEDNGYSFKPKIVSGARIGIGYRF